VLAGRKPGLVSAVILADPTFLEPSVQREVRDSNVADQHRQLLTWTLEKLVADARRRHPKRSMEILELLAAARLQTSMAAFDVLTPPNPEFRKLVPKIQVPMLLITSENGVVSRALAEELCRLQPALQLKHLPEAGHALHLDQPERFELAVKSFLSSLG